MIDPSDASEANNKAVTDQSSLRSAVKLIATRALGSNESTVTDLGTIVSAADMNGSVTASSELSMSILRTSTSSRLNSLALWQFLARMQSASEGPCDSPVGRIVKDVCTGESKSAPESGAKEAILKHWKSISLDMPGLTLPMTKYIRLCCLAGSASDSVLSPFQDEGGSSTSKIDV